MQKLTTYAFLFMALLFASATAHAQNAQVTFQLDATALVDSCQIGPESPNPDAFISLRGNFNEYAEDEHLLTDEDGDGIYTVTVALAEGEFDYKFYHSGLGWENGVEGSTHPDGNRQITIEGDEAVTVEAATYNNTFENVCGQTTTAVTIEVDATEFIEKCQLGPDSANPEATLSLPGVFNGWTPGADVLTDENEDGIYSITLELLPGDYEFKIHHSDLQWEDGDNRPLTVGSEPTTVGPLTYNKTIPNGCGATLQCVDVYFRVNMGPQIASGAFNPDVNLVTVAGPHNGWNTTADTLEAETRDPNIYSKLIEIEDQLVPGEIEHKFVTGTIGGAQDGWEGISGNRFLPVTGDETDFDGNGCIDVEADPVPFFADEGWEDLFSQDATMTIEVDARPAFYFLADSGYVPGHYNNAPVDQLDDFESLFINGPVAGGWEEDWSPTGLGSLEARELVDDGTNGDEVAGDSIYTWQVERAAGGSRIATFKLSLDGHDNENAVGADHRIMFPDEAEPTVRVVFGAAHVGEGEYESTLYYPYISIDESGPYVVRGGGDIVTGIEEIGPELPGAISLGQNYPNPFNPSTSFEYSIDKMQQVRVQVYDLTGRVVATLVDGVQPAATYRVTFDGAGLASGLYIYQLETPSRTISKKMVLLK